MYAIIKTGGKQIKVTEGEIIKVEKLPAESNEKYFFNEVMMVENNGEIKVGSPFVEGSTVEATVLNHGKAKKIIVFKYKSKKNYKKKQGHRQPFTQLRIEKING